ncbi:MAG: hypothetical protein U5L96_14750 [Owenweeksia sp.]|nr:hypothetical protein [Owenweeksia sp.]
MVDAKVEMYCVTEKDNDFILNEKNWTLKDWAIPAVHFSSGKWVAKITVHEGDRSYYFDPEIVIP